MTAQVALIVGLAIGVLLGAGACAVVINRMVAGKSLPVRDQAHAFATIAACTSKLSINERAEVAAWMMMRSQREIMQARHQCGCAGCRAALGEPATVDEPAVPTAPAG